MKRGHCHCCREYGKGEKSQCVLSDIETRLVLDRARYLVISWMHRPMTEPSGLLFCMSTNTFLSHQPRGISTAITTRYISALYTNLRPALITLAMLLKNTTTIVQKRKRDCLLTILILCILDSCLHTKPHYVARPSILLIAESYFLRHLRAIPKFQKYLY